MEDNEGKPKAFAHPSVSYSKKITYRIIDTKEKRRMAGHNYDNSG
jgi:hypothetical protein